ncbi:MAG: lasso peptide biosynthesis PqqD family chaperone [Saccharofermentans sp.]|nr:lasso peptide biosynthesis PqqD family chaperone [Saccharofermentans sp.]
MVKLTDKVMQREDLVAADMGDETVMMDIMSGKYFKLSEVGGSIWNKIEAPKLVSDLIAELLTEYDVSEEECTNQTIEFLTQLVNKGIVVVE